MTKRRNAKRRSHRPNSRQASTRKQLNLQALEKRELLAAEFGPRLISVAANSGQQFELDEFNPLTSSPKELTFRFDGGQEIDAGTLSSFRFTASGGDGDFTDGDEVVITPGSIGLGESSRIVVARFGQELPDDQYRISIAGFADSDAGIEALRNVDGATFVATDPLDPNRPTQDIFFDLEVGPKVVAVVPQPISGTGTNRTQARDTVEVYFNEDLLNAASAQDTSFYQLYATGDTVETQDDLFFSPDSATYDSSLNRVTLVFEDDLENLPGVLTDGSATFRLRVGSSEAAPVTLANQSGDRTVDSPDTFSQATDTTLTFGARSESVTIEGIVEAPVGNTIQWPGIDSPYVREERRDAQIVGRADTNDGVDIFFYNFADLYGEDAIGNQLENAITPAQQQRIREILDLYSEHLGVQFIETEDSGLQFVTGDLRALVETATTGPGAPFQEFRINDADPTRGVLILDAGENWFDGYGLSPNNDPSYFVEALRGVGNLLGIGNTFEQPPGVASGSNPALGDATVFNTPEFSIEPDFLSASDIIPGQALHRPEIKDADLYRFEVSESGRLSIESFAERRISVSLLDTDLRLWKLNPASGEYDLISRNDDFYGEDSFIGLDVSPNEDGTPARYVIGITAKGNDNYNPNIAGSGGGGRSSGDYELRLSFERTGANTIVDTTGSRLDGDSDGKQGGNFNFWFRVAPEFGVPAAGQPRTLFVNKTDGNDDLASGSLANPLQSIEFALQQAAPGDVVRLLPDAGADGLVGTTADNRAYEIGRDSNGTILEDGEFFNVPRGVTVMIDAGAIVKLQNAKIGVGSETIDEDRSLASLQVLGAPTYVDDDGSQIDGSVNFTSLREESRGGALLGIDNNPLTTVPTSGDWGGIEFRNDVDFSEGRPVYETEGIFVDYVSHADIRYGGGSVTSGDPIVTPIQLDQSRPTLIYNEITFSSDAAISADPDSFLETNFHAPLFQQASLDRHGELFTSDYDRVGPLVRGNDLRNNSINGLFVRVETPAVGQREPMTVSGRFDDADITHVLSEVLVLQGSPGGDLLLEDQPDVLSTIVSNVPGSAVGSLNNGDLVDYIVTFVTTAGYESRASVATASVPVDGSGAIRLDNLPEATDGFASRRLYRRTTVAGVPGAYTLVTSLDRVSATYVDDGVNDRGGLLPLVAQLPFRLLPRTEARLSIDPGLVVKLDSARIEATFGADFYAEGTDGSPVVFTSRLDDRFGGGASFDLTNDGTSGVPQAGDWGGLVFRQGSTASLDFVTVAFAGGESATDGGFARFNPIEILQADVRIANSFITQNAGGYTGTLDTRDGVGFNREAAIFVRGSQPILVNNTITENEGAAISINPDALNYETVADHGRGTGLIDQFVTDVDNQGPLIEANRLADNSVNGLVIRSEAITTESVWDDTDIVHVVEFGVIDYNHHHRGGLRLKSDTNQSLVVKFGADGFLGSDRSRGSVEDSLGGRLQVLGQPGFPVILTSLSDSTVGAGFTPDGVAQTDTNGPDPDVPSPGDWQGLFIRSGSNDRNVPFIAEAERAVATAAAQNAIANNAQFLGSLAQDEVSADENRRLGFDVRGALSQVGDVDVFEFIANGGTEVFIDIDDTQFGLDTVVELIDGQDNILAISNSSFAESVDPTLLINNLDPGDVLPLRKTGEKVVENPNPLDAGMRVILPGNSETVNEYFVRVRSSNARPGDTPSQIQSRLQSESLVGAGLSSGQYSLSVRLKETDEVSGSTVRLADIRYAFDALSVPSAVNSSPLTAETAERLDANGVDINDGAISFDGTEGSASFTNGNADPVGNISISDRGVLRTSGVLGNNVLATDPNFATLTELDIDVFRVDLFQDAQEPDIIGENRFVSTIFDVDYADQLGRANTSLAVYTADGRLILHSRDSNIADDQGRPTDGNDQTNLSAGSAGTLDAYIGPVEIQVGTYYVVVSSAQVIPESLNQLFNANPADDQVRVYPIESTRRIGEVGFDEGSIDVNSYVDTFESQALNRNSELPIVQPLFDETSIVPYKLEDVPLFLTLDGGFTGNNQSSLISINPFSATLERTIGQFGQPVDDVAIRRDGELFSYSLGPATGARNAGNTGNFLNIDSGDAASNNVGDDGLTFQRNNDAGAALENDPTAELSYSALTFVPTSGSVGISPTVNNPQINQNERALAVGFRDNQGNGFEIPFNLTRNVLYSVRGDNGAATNRGSTAANTDRDFDPGPYDTIYGPASNRFELGIIDTGQFTDSPTRVTFGSPTISNELTGIAIDPILGAGTTYGVTNQGYVYTFDGTGFDRRDAPGTNFVSIINSTHLGLVQPDPSDTVSVNRGFVAFTGMTLGPRYTESTGSRSGVGPFAQTMFATTAEGWLYTFQVEDDGINPPTVAPAYVLKDGNYALQITEPDGDPINFSPTGAAFSTREENPWHQTNDRGTSFDHGVEQSHNQSRIDQAGGSSLYFGFEPTANANDNAIEGGAANGTLSPGGSQGTVVSRPFSLEGYDFGDKPTLYYSYFLETSPDSEFIPAVRNQTDSFRAYAAGDDGRWQLLATNNSWRSFSNVPDSDEFDEFLESGIPVQEHFENTNAWRQARVDLSPLAGNKNVQIRFDFATAGAIGDSFLRGEGTEIVAPRGTDIVDGTGFTLQSTIGSSVDPLTPNTRFDFLRGAQVVLPPSNLIPDGQELTFVGDNGPVTVRLVSGPAGAANEISIIANREILATRIVTLLNSMDPTLAAESDSFFIRVPEADSFSITPEQFENAGVPLPTDSQYSANGSVPIFYHEDMSTEEVRDAIRDALARGLGNRDDNGVSTATLANYPEFGTNRIRLEDKQVLFNNSVAGVNVAYPGDEFGSFGSSIVGTGAGGINTRPVSQNDGIEGVYLDDIVIGFAERGEVVHNAPVNRNFDVLPETRTFTFADNQQPEFPNEILVGDYTLEVRTGSEYGVPEDYDPIRLALNEQGGFGRSFDTNDRLVRGVTLIAPSASEVNDGDIFVLSNGSQNATFEFTTDGTVAQGRVAVPIVDLIAGSGYLEDENDADALASSIRDAINSPQARNVLGIRAAGTEGTEVGLQSGNRIVLFSDNPVEDTIQVNPSSGRFVQVDLVAEETFYGREGARTLPEVDHDAQIVADTFFLDTFAQATVTDFVNGDTDTLVAVGKIGDNVLTDDANALIPTAPEADVDIVKIYLEQGNRIDIDLDTLGFAQGTVMAQPIVTIYDESQNQVGVSSLAAAPGEFAESAFINGFEAPVSGYYFVAVSSDGFIEFHDGFGEYQLTIRPDVLVSAGTPVPTDPLMVDYHHEHGDQNVFRPQGQLVIESNFIRDFANIGIHASAFDSFGADNDGNFAFPTPIDRRPGGATTLRNVNTDRLVPGTIIANNVVIADAGTAIRYSGENTGNNDSPTPVPFGRIVNNTVVGGGTGTGILAEQSVSPTILNNLVVGFDTGVSVAADSTTTVANGNAFQNNTTDSNLGIGAASFVIPDATALFEDAAGRVFIPADGSAVIDSSFASLNDRSNFVNTVKAPIGIASSPILSPEFDAYGIPRFDDPDVTTPGGVGSNVFIDRGAIDRADFDGPEARLVAPIDFVGGGGAAIVGGDNDPANSFVRLIDGSVEFFEIQLTDPSGSGPDGRTITEDTVLVTENGRRLENGVDYVFGYSDNSNVVRLTPLAGLWRTDSVYEITLNNQDRVAYQAPAGDLVSDGDQVSITDIDGNTTVFEYESGYALVAPRSTTLVVDGTRDQFTDRDSFTISAPNGNEVTFEINLVGGVGGGNVPINLQSAGTIAEIRDAIFLALSGTVPGQPSLSIPAFLDITPAVVGQDEIQLGDSSGHGINSVAGGLVIEAGAGRIADGDSFLYETETESIRFEFDNDVSTIDPDAVPIPFANTDTPADVAAAIVRAVQLQPLGLSSAIALADGRAILGGVDGDTVTITPDTSPLVLEGNPGVTGGLAIEIPLTENGGTLNDTAFTVTVDGTDINFRFTTDPNLASVDRLIVVENTSSAADVAALVELAVADAFPGQLSPSADGASVLLGETPATSSTPSLVTFTDLDSGLSTSGVSGGAIAVPYLPSGSPTSIAAALQGAVQSTPLNVQTFSPGGGTLLFTDAAQVQSRSAEDLANGNTAGFVDGDPIPAIADLAGNAVGNTRNDGETRFTIIMPEVTFDFGDAPEEYATLLQDNGARHTVSIDQTPRLGDFVDSESDGQAIDNDDSPVIVLSFSPDAAIVVDNLAIADTSQIQLVSVPVGGELLEVTVGSDVVRYEFVDIFSTASPGNIAITVDAGESISDVRDKLRVALAGTLPGAGDTVVVSTASSDLVRIRAVDDEDGVLVATFVDNTDINNPVPFEVFVAPGTDPTNVGPEDVLGFLNRRDPAGATVAVNVAGSGLLQAWIDFDQNGTFDADEQVVTNRPVSGDPITGSINFVSVVTPLSAAEGRTWMRVRISESGNLEPTGVAVGGEVEDYEVEIYDIDLPVPQPDSYSILEDTTLDTLADNPTPDLIRGVGENDDIPAEAFLPVQYIVTGLPQSGTLVSFDSSNGEFVYQPAPDFFGTDTFTYRLSTQQNANSNGASPVEPVTVTIEVAPVNDAPGGVDATVNALEDSIRTLTRSELLAGASGDADSQGSTGLQNESNQIASLRIESIAGNGPAVTAANAADGGLIAVTPDLAGGLDLTVPAVNDILTASQAVVITLAFGGNVQSFQLVPAGASIVAGTPVPVLLTDSLESLSDRLADAIEDEFDNVNVSSSNDTITLVPVVSTVSVLGDVTVLPVADGLLVDVPAVVVPTAAPTEADPDPAIGHTVTVEVDGTATVYEFLATGATAADGNVGVELVSFANPNSPAASADATAALVAAINGTLAAGQLPVAATIVDGATNPNRILISNTGVTAAVPQATDRGTILPIFDSSGALLEVGYLGSRDLNRDNPAPTPPIHLDQFTLVIVDNGVSVNPDENLYDYGPRAMSAPVTISVQVMPQNDAPVLESDSVSVGPLGPAAASVITAWELAGGATPTEDSPITIPTSFLLQNDSQGRDTAADENAVDSVTDADLAVISVAMLDPSQGQVTLQGTDIIFTPAADLYGDIVFTYSARDQGVNVDIDGVSSSAPLITTNGLVTVTVQPVNDAPVPSDRTLTFSESADPGTGPAFQFTNEDLIVGSAGETPSIPGQFNASLGAPFDEAVQTPGLRVASFTTLAGTVDRDDLVGSGVERLTLPSDTGGLYEFVFNNGEFVSGSLTTTADFNQRITPTDAFSFTIIDDGLTTDPADPLNTFTIERAVSETSATATLIITETNDAPTFNVDAPLRNGIPTIDVLERDDDGGTSTPGFLIDILPGPFTATDETALQNVTFSFPAALNTDLGPFRQLPQLLPNGTLTVFPAADQIGTATFVAEAIDDEPGTAGFVPRTTLVTFAVTVRPVNDAPRFDSERFNGTNGEEQDSLDADDAYLVDTNGPVVTYTFREDNAQPNGDDGPAIVIPLRQGNEIDFNRIGLLDLFTVGPDNEADGSEGGSQSLSYYLGPVDPITGPVLTRETDLGGEIVAVLDDNGVVSHLLYTPPDDLNSDFAGLDSFTYQVIDDSVAGETYDIEDARLVENSMISQGTVQIQLNPVNDRPEFTLESIPPVQEDSSVIQIDSFARGIFAGPPETAFDEIDPSTGQLVEFTITSLDFLREDADIFFSIFPEISEETGQLIYQPAANVFGEFRFEVILTDSNQDGSQSNNTERGDLISSLPQTIVVAVNPVNDPPEVNEDADPIVLVTDEDTSTTVDISALEGIFRPGPGGITVGGGADDPTDESLVGKVGGGQTVTLADPEPSRSAFGGTIRTIVENGVPRLEYTPRENFVGTDSFIYLVTDDGITINAAGETIDNPRISSNIVTIEVNPINDEPEFSGAASVTVNEDVGATTIAGWATNVRSGPATATDELEEQTLSFVVTQVGPGDAILTGTPTVTINSDGTADLNFETIPDASGSVTYSVVLEDNGSDNLPNVNRTSPPREFTINVLPINDPPTFEFVGNGDVVIDEDAGPFASVQVVNFSPGPLDEVDQTVSFAARLVNPEDASKFTEVPTIDGTGLLRFVVAPNANTQSGPIEIEVTATDSGGAVSPGTSFFLTISPVNDIPQAFNDTFNVDEDLVSDFTAADFFANDIDPDRVDGDVLTLDLLMSPGANTRTTSQGAVISIDPNTGVISYDPSTSLAIQAVGDGQTTTDTFTYRLTDSSGAISNTATVTLSITGQNDAPIVRDDSPTLNTSGVTVVDVLNNDEDIDGSIDPSRLEITFQPSFGTVSIDVDTQSVVYNPVPGSTFDDFFRYRVADNDGLFSEEATVTLSANTAPVANNDVAGAFLSESTLINLAANDVDPDGSLDLDSIVVVTPPARGQAVIQGNGSVLYLPNAGFTGTDTFNYTIADDEGRVSNVARVSVQVVASRLQNPGESNDVNDDGRISPIDSLLVINHLRREGSRSIPVLDTDQGPDFFDVNGDMQITPSDALSVINTLRRLNNNTSGESAAPSDSFEPVSIDTLAPAVLAFEPESSRRLAAEIETFEQADQVADFSVADAIIEDALEVMVEAASTEGTGADSENAGTSAVDAALNEFLVDLN